MSQPAWETISAPRGDPRPRRTKAVPCAGYFIYNEGCRWCYLRNRREQRLVRVLYPVEGQRRMGRRWQWVDLLPCP